jgi:hypothetical protein
MKLLVIYTFTQNLYNHALNNNLQNFKVEKKCSECI